MQFRPELDHNEANHANALGNILSAWCLEPRSSHLLRPNASELKRRNDPSLKDSLTGNDQRQARG